MKKDKYVLISGLFFLSGCSSIIEGRSQEIVINTNPPGATCTLVRNDMPIGTVTPTPSAILIEKTKYDMIVKCNKDGYQEATYFNKSDAAGATVGNVILGGGIGWAIDSATGSDNKYDSPLNITLVPNENVAVSQKHDDHNSQVQAKIPAPAPYANGASVLTPLAALSEPTKSDTNFPAGKNGGN